MVHGGAWSIGDKNNAAVVKIKSIIGVNVGGFLISVNYRLVPNATITATDSRYIKCFTLYSKNMQMIGMQTQNGLFW